jgi:hypothetical protein
MKFQQAIGFTKAHVKLSTPSTEKVNVSVIFELAGRL